uniref:Uncharacterized protein n=1 Tax=Kuenenia stuttgartiensis TaxID=174633 RepID=Q1Q1X7_KUEST|nr:unknown protein [Candidatus Kuenenia stuttgartiensis]
MGRIGVILNIECFDKREHTLFYTIWGVVL